MEFIDAHAHIYERLSGFGPRGEARAIGGGMVEWATGEKERFLKAEHGDYGFSPEMLISLMDEANVNHAVLLQGSNYGFQNSFTAEAVSKYPDRLTGAGTFDPYAGSAKEIFNNIIHNLKFKILKFELSEIYGLVGYHPEMTVDGQVFEQFLKAAEESDITVVFDTGEINTKSFQIEGIAKVSRRHPNLNIVVAHTLFPNGDGMNEHRIELVKMLKRDNVFYDVASLLYPDCYSGNLGYIKKIMESVGSDHIAWGSDCPGVFRYYSYQQLIDYVLNSGYFTDTELTNLMSETARYIYKIGI